MKLVVDIESSNTKVYHLDGEAIKLEGKYEIPLGETYRIHKTFDKQKNNLITVLKKIDYTEFDCYFIFTTAAVRDAGDAGLSFIREIEEKIQVQIQIISQRLEAHFGYLAAESHIEKFVFDFFCITTQLIVI
eukprot:gene12162-5652_t